MALTKTMKFDEDTAATLARMTWSDDGLIGYLPDEKMERKEYEAINKALDAMGGKWNRKLKGHVFETDPREQAASVASSGELIVERDGFFQTPEAVVERMLELVPLKLGEYNTYLEPSAGLGAIVKSLIAHGVQSRLIFAIEKNAYRAEFLKGLDINSRQGDFLTVDNPMLFDRIYMNPPFEEGQDIEHVKLAFELLKPEGWLVSVMGDGAFFREDRKATAFREWLRVVGGMVFPLPAHSFRESGTDVKTDLVVIQKR